MSRSFYVEITCAASTSSGGCFEAHLDEVMEALQAGPGVRDADIGARLDVCEVDFCLHLIATTPGDAIAQAMVVVWSALHAAGGATPGWEDTARAIADDDTRVTVQPADLLSA